MALTKVFLWWTQSPTNASTSSATSPASCVSMQLAIYLFFLHFFISAYTCADLTNQDIRRGSTPATFSPKPTVMKLPSLRSMSTQQFRVICLCYVILPYTPAPYFISFLNDVDNSWQLHCIKVEMFVCKAVHWNRSFNSNNVFRIFLGSLL